MKLAIQVGNHCVFSVLVVLMASCTFDEVNGIEDTGYAPEALPTPPPTPEVPTKRVVQLSSNRLRFAIVGDMGRGNPGQRHVGDALAKYCAAHGCDFIQTVGDNIYPVGVTSSTANTEFAEKFY